MSREAFEALEARQAHGRAITNFADRRAEIGENVGRLSAALSLNRILEEEIKDKEKLKKISDLVKKLIENSGALK